MLTCPWLQFCGEREEREEKKERGDGDIIPPYLWIGAEGNKENETASNFALASTLLIPMLRKISITSSLKSNGGPHNCTDERGKQGQ